MSDDVVHLEGVVEDIKGHSFFTVKLSCGDCVLAKVAGRSKRIARRLMPGAKVEIEVSTYDLSRGRIIKLIQ
ncbi:MAG: translation initiation factor IF-1 [bacterium]|nr:translation initiation factor IF-1 [bacterium]